MKFVSFNSFENSSSLVFWSISSCSRRVSKKSMMLFRS